MWWYLTVLGYRHGVAKVDAKREANIPEPLGIDAYKNLRYAKGFGKWQKLDVYRPRALSGKLPLIVVCHGGGWIYGDKELYHKYAMDLARRGFATLCFNYVRAPRKRFPFQLQEMDEVMAYAKEHAEQFGFDLANVFVVGDSGGAQMSAQYAAAETNPEFGKLFSLRFPLQIKGLGLNCGVYCSLGEPILDPKTTDPRLSKAEDDLIHAYIGKTDKNDPRLAILPYVTKAFPPSYVLTGEKDFIKAQNPPFIKKLEEVGVKHIFKEYTSKEGDKLQHVFHVTINEEHAILANDEECAFFKSLMV
jgi:acetyl esterase/lipase